MLGDIRRACVIGAGTMGAAIAAHLANSGIPVDLLDVPPEELTAEETAQGLTLADPAVRNRLVTAGFERMRKARPAALANEDSARLVRLGNTEDHFDRVAQADWIIEAIVERLEPKRAMMARLEAARQADAVVSSNTSGIPIRWMADGRTPEFRAHFLGTHFFNPPRYMKLLEIIPSADTDRAVVDFMARLGERALGKGVVICKDTPNFVANRLSAIWSSFALDYSLANGYTIEEVDALTGELIGRPRTATFRLFDLVGLDVAVAVRRNLHDMIPGDEAREVLLSPHLHWLISAMLERGWLGNKTGQGFYKQILTDDGRQFWSLNPETLEYEPPKNPQFESVARAREVQPLGERLKRLLAAEDRAGQLIRTLTYFNLAYASQCLPEIADDVVSVDNALRWGYLHEAGPFELWDMLGVPETAAQIEASGYRVADWVKEMLATGRTTFYERRVAS
jgi:3-hydroxyacyl-CoA dehydrogenase